MTLSHTCEILAVIALCLSCIALCLALIALALSWLIVKPVLRGLPSTRPVQAKNAVRRTIEPVTPETEQGIEYGAPQWSDPDADTPVISLAARTPGLRQQEPEWLE
jgi:hypothetical protein